MTSLLEHEILLVAATELELCGHAGLVCGVGPVEAAATISRELALNQPRAVVNVGIAGSRGLTPGTVVIGSEAFYCDLGAEIPIVDRVRADHGARRRDPGGASRGRRPPDRDERIRDRLGTSH